MHGLFFFPLFAFLVVGFFGGFCFVSFGFLKMTLTLFIKLFSSRNALHQRDAGRLPGYREKRELPGTMRPSPEGPGAGLARYRSAWRTAGLQLPDGKAQPRRGKPELPPRNKPNGTGSEEGKGHPEVQFKNVV